MPSKQRPRDIIKAARVEKIADVVGCSKRYVNMVIEGDRSNDDLLGAYMFIQEGENRLLEAVKQLVPFNTVAR